MSEVRRLFCEYCRGESEFEAEDGFYNCVQCGSQSQDVISTAADEGDVHAALEDGRGSIYSHIIQRKISKIDPNHADPGRSLEQSLREGDQPMNFGSGLPRDASTIANGIRIRYVQGLQLMLQKQCEALVEKFSVSPIICSVAPSIWLRYVTASRVFEESWISDQIALSQESQRISEKDHVLFVLHSLRKAIPIYSTISISFLSCHIAREVILPTDITNWAINSKLPYLSSFLEMEKFLGPPSTSCPLNSRSLFRPVVLLSSWQLETIATKIANKVGLQLPPVNYYALSKRFLQELSLPSEKILPEASRVFEWLLPAEMWMSSNQYGIPTRVSVMAILVITLRILYDINGQGVWEMSLCDINEKSEVLKKENDENEMDFKMESEFCARDLLIALEASYDKIEVKHDYTNDLDSYLKYCKDVIFPKMTATVDEETFIDRFWKFYNNDKDNNDDNKGENIKCELSDINRKRSSDEISASSSLDLKNKQLKPSKNSSCDSSRSKAIERMRLEMEENEFFYLTPILKKKSKGYISYRRVKLDRELAYVAHADYYIILRAFARLAQVDVRIMHSSVLELERKLVWFEERISTCLNASKDRPVEKREMDVDSD